LFFKDVVVDEPEVETALAGIQLAAEQGHLNVVKLLADNGADINGGEKSAFCMAAQNGRVDIIKYFYKMIDVDTAPTAMQLATISGHLDVVRLLARHGVDIFSEEQSAFLLAAWNGHADIVKCLHEMIDIETRQSELKRAFDVAFERGHSDVVKVILQAGVFSDGGSMYQFPFHAAIQQNISADRTKELLKLILKVGHDINEKDHDGRSPLHIAAHCNLGAEGAVIS